MIDDIVQKIFVKDVEENYCKHYYCKQVSKKTQPNGDFFCCGILKRPNMRIPYDVISFCDYKAKTEETGEFKMWIQTPDEALTISRLLTIATEEWLINNKDYNRFRNNRPLLGLGDALLNKLMKWHYIIFKK